MSTLKSFRDLDVWKASVNIVSDIYDLTKKFPNDEKFGLTNQIQRSAVSIPSNIAEGFDRNSNKDKIHFMVIARGSTAELNTQLIIAKNLGYITKQKLDDTELELTNIHKMLNGFISYLRKNDDKSLTS